MGWNRCLLDLMSDTCTVFNPATSTAPSFYGVTTVESTGTVYNCRFRPKREEFRFVDYQGITETGQLVIATTSTGAVTPESKIQLSDGRSPAILSVEYPRDEDGVHHCRVKFGFRQGN